jgi:hypothetical protein
MDTESPPKIVDLMAAHLGAADGRARAACPIRREFDRRLVQDSTNL